MPSVLADELIARVNAIIKIGKKKQGIDDEDLDELKGHYFYIGFIVMGNMAYIASALELAATLRKSLAVSEPTIEELKQQLLKMTGQNDDSPIIGQPPKH